VVLSNCSVLSLFTVCVGLLCSELEHVSQYKAMKGITPFLLKYVVQAGIAIGSRGSINVHDSIQLEKDATNKAARIIDEVMIKLRSRPLMALHEACDHVSKSPSPDCVAAMHRWYRRVASTGSCPLRSPRPSAL
jgi:hypothetical protein